MYISVTITRDENAEYFGVSPGDTVQVGLEDYVAAVTASELASGGTEGCRAQAVAARTFAVSCGVLDGKAISDSSKTAQAYRAKRNDPAKYPTAVQAAKDTAGLILAYNGKAIPAVYSASNGGRTVSSKERWGSDRPYLPAQDDPWDAAAGTGKTGHGVGMSQRGARYAASIGKTYQEILGFYYPGTTLSKLNDETKGADRMIRAADFVEQVQIPLREGWGYIYGTHGVLWTKEKQAAATREQTVQYGAQWIGHMVTDCSGLVYWACLELGEKVVHHATYLYTDWSRPKGRLVSIMTNEAGETKGRDDGQPIKPGTLVFIKGTQEKIHHVGVYIGNDTVVEAKGTKSGVVTSRLSHWEYWGELKVLDYTGAEAPESEEKPMSKTTRAVVTNPHTKLNVRSAPNKKASKVCQVLKGTIVDVLDMSNEEWWLISYNGKTGYAASEFLTLKGSDEVMIKPQAEPENYPMPDIPGWDIDEPETPPAEDHEIEEQETEESVEEQAAPDPMDVLAALKSAHADLEILLRLTDDAQKAQSLEQLIEILNAMDIVLPQIDASRKAMWNLITVG